MSLIAREAGLDAVDFDDGASFSELGIDSLMSLVISEKFREELGVAVSGSLFLEYPTIGDLRSRLLEYYRYVGSIRVFVFFPLHLELYRMGL